MNTEQELNTQVETGSRLVVALDFDRMDPCMDLVSQLDPNYCRLKIGKELFTAGGPQIVERVQAQGFDVFLDLKFHDIPNTVAKAVKTAASLGVWMVNVHASGGRKMMDAAANALSSFDHAPLLIAVTVLTSMSQDELSAMGVDGSVESHVERLAKMSKDAGFDGVVSSAREASSIKRISGSAFVCVTPGIRPLQASADDQHRIMTPEQAIIGGSDYLVVGRPITQAVDPLLAAKNIYDEIQSALRS